MYICPIFGKIISRHGVKPDQKRLKVQTEMSPPKTKKELQAFLGIINYLSTFSPSTASICESLRQLTSSKTEWTWNATYQKLFDKAKSIIKEDACMKLYYYLWFLCYSIIRFFLSMTSFHCLQVSFIRSCVLCPWDISLICIYS